MTDTTIKLIVFIMILIHGIGHIQGVIASFGIKFNKSTTFISWALKSLSGNTNKYLCLLLYLSTAILGMLGALSFYELIVPHSVWQLLLILTAITSSIGLVLFPKVLAMLFNKLGAIAVNLIIFYSLVFDGDWPAAAFD
jgi:hypothetical protein